MSKRTIIIVSLLINLGQVSIFAQEKNSIESIQEFMTYNKIDSINIDYYVPIMLGNIIININQHKVEATIKTSEVESLQICFNQKLDDEIRKFSINDSVILLNDSISDYVLSRINALFVKKTNKIYVKKLKMRDYAESDCPLLYIKRHKGKTINNQQIVVGDVYETRLQQVGYNKISYSFLFRSLIQTFDYIIACNSTDDIKKRFFNIPETRKVISW